MWTPRRDRAQDHLSAYWNALNRGAPPEELARLAGPLDPSFIAAIDRARALHRRRRPDPAFATRLEQDLMDAFATAPAGSVPLRPVPPQPTNGQTVPRERWSWLPALPVSRERRHWAVAQLATALLLVVTLLAVWVAFRPENNRGVSPGGTPAAIPAPTEPAVPMFRANPARTGVMPGPGPVGTPAVRWRTEAIADGRVVSAPAVVDGVVYAGAGDVDEPGVVVALDAATGAVRWRVELDGGAGTSSPAVAGGIVYVATMGGGLYALDAATGAVRWFAPLINVQPFSSPAVVGGTVYVGESSSPAVVDGIVYYGSSGSPSTVYAFDAATGVRRWQTAAPEAGIHALDAETGAVKWVFATAAPVESAAAVAGGLVYAWDTAGGLYAVDAATGQERWQQQIGFTGGHGAPGVADGMVYSLNMGPPGSDLVALDAATGTERWRFHFPAPNQSSPALVDGVVYIGGGVEDRHLYALDAATGEQRWALDLGDDVDSSPAVVGGIVYVGTGYWPNRGQPGYVYAIGGGPAATPAGAATP
jgi:outer membrane protein assembly factor BamB